MRDWLAVWRSPVSRVVSVAVWVALAVGCSSNGSGENGYLERPSLGATFNCGNPINRLDAPPADYRLVLDVVALPDVESHQRGRVGPDNDPGSVRAFSKFGLIVRQGSNFEIHVGPDSQGNALMRWGNTGPADPVSSLRINDCDGSSEWLVYPGGVWTLYPACVTLIAIAGQDAEEIHVPIGAPC